jgi:RNA polymerase sigma factor (sigma-70 family)
LSENELIEKLKSKEQAAFRIFIDNNKSKVMNTCFSFLHNRHDAEDVAQEVFIEVFLSIRNFRGDSSLNTWVYRICINKCTDFHRKKSRKRRFAKVLSFFDLNSSESAELLNKETDPIGGLESSDDLQFIQKAIEKLPVNQRVALTLNKIEGYSYKEIAEILKTTQTAVDSLLQRARKNLKKYLENDGFLLN